MATTTKTSSVSFDPLPLGGLSTFWTYIAYLALFGGLGLDLARRSKIRFSRKWFLEGLTPGSSS